MIQLLPQDQELLDSLESAERFQQRFGADVSASLEPAREVVKQSLAHQSRIGIAPPWNGYLSIDESAGTVVGAGGYKGNPSAEKTVEIAYITFPAFEARGFGKATAAALVEIARTADAVDTVLAHTLPEKSPSTGILQGLGFDFLGPVEDPDDGDVWRFSLELKADP